MKKLKILTIVFVSLFTLMACGDGAVPQSQPDSEEQTPVQEQNDSGVSKQRPEVSDEDLANVPEDALVIPLTELHEHELYNIFDQWTLCHLTGDCTQGAWADSITLNNDDLTFQVSDRTAMPATEEYIYACETNERNNLLICEVTGESAGAGMIGATDSSIQYPELTVKMTDATTFEIWHTDGIKTDESEGTRDDLIELLESESTMFSLNIKHEEMNGELVATHVLIMIFK